MVRLIATDIDGTIVAEGQSNINPEYFEVIKKLTDHGVIFAAASGRHSCSVKRVFGPVLDRIWILSQNGSAMEHKGQSKVPFPIPREWVAEFWNDLKDIGTVESMIETPALAYCPIDGSPMHQVLLNKYKYDILPTGGWDKIPEETISMLGIYHPQSSDAFYHSSDFITKWQKRLTMIVTGKTWIDCFMPGNSKGAAVRDLCDTYGISLDEVVTFGDNMNDISMLEVAGTSYAVDTARQEVQDAATHVIPGYQSHGVLAVLKEILKTYE